LNPVLSGLSKVGQLCVDNLAGHSVIDRGPGSTEPESIRRSQRPLTCQQDPASLCDQATLFERFDDHQQWKCRNKIQPA
jgi:hypothetical protein